jgi:hypothetical protein
MTWLVISGDGSGGGVYRTATAGRVNGQISMNAWTRVDAMEHEHGAFTPWYDVAGKYLYFPTKQGVKRSNDGGASWTSVYSMGSMGTLVGTQKYLYGEALYQNNMWRAAASQPTTWSTFAVPTAATWNGAVPPYGAASSFDGQHWVIVRSQYQHASNNSLPLVVNGEIWRYIEP